MPLLGVVFTSPRATTVVFKPLGKGAFGQNITWRRGIEVRWLWIALFVGASLFGLVILRSLWGRLAAIILGATISPGIEARREATFLGVKARFSELGLVGRCP